MLPSISCCVETVDLHSASNSPMPCSYNVWDPPDVFLPSGSCSESAETVAVPSEASETESTKPLCFINIHDGNGWLYIECRQIVCISTDR